MTTATGTLMFGTLQKATALAFGAAHKAGLFSLSSIILGTAHEASRETVTRTQLSAGRAAAIGLGSFIVALPIPLALAAILPATFIASTAGVITLLVLPKLAAFGVAMLLTHDKSTNIRTQALEATAFAVVFELFVSAVLRAPISIMT